MTQDIAALFSLVLAALFTCLGADSGSLSSQVLPVTLLAVGGLGLIFGRD